MRAFLLRIRGKHMLPFLGGLLQLAPSSGHKRRRFCGAVPYVPGLRLPLLAILAGLVERYL